MDDILEKSKQFTILTHLRSTYCKDIIRGNLIVMEFIKKHNLIIYGGTAIDMALRLVGSKLYPDNMLDFSDFDFMSPEQEHAYELVDLLYANGMPAARCIVAMHASTLRVDIGGNNWIADISYMPKILFDKIPTLLYEGMRIVHPDYQRIDQHRSLSFPLLDAPHEAILHRASKDIGRFLLLDEAYPFTRKGINRETGGTTHKIPPESIGTGLYAFLAIKEAFISALPITVLNGLPDEFIKRSSVVARLDVCTCAVVTGEQHYAAIMDIIPERVETDGIRHYLIKQKIAATKLWTEWVASIAYIMYESLARAFLLDELDGFDLYVKCLEILHLAELDGVPQELRESLFYPAVDTFGKFPAFVESVEQALRGAPQRVRMSGYSKVSKAGKVQTEWPTNRVNDLEYRHLDGRSLNKKEIEQPQTVESS
jgi:hypothetical protein